MSNKLLYKYKANDNLFFKTLSFKLVLGKRGWYNVLTSFLG